MSYINGQPPPEWSTEILSLSLFEYVSLLATTEVAFSNVMLVHRNALFGLCLYSITP